MQTNPEKPAGSAPPQKPPAEASKPQASAPEKPAGKKPKQNPVDDFISKIRQSIKKVSFLERADEMFYSGVKVIAGLGIQNILNYKVEGKENIPIIGKGILVTISDNSIATMAALMN